MKSCLIVGSGRSGTSLTAGLLANSGYFMGTKFPPPDVGNPKGYFEDFEVNAINEELINSAVPDRSMGFVSKFFGNQRPVAWQGWLKKVPLHAVIASNLALNQRIRALTGSPPFCFKDPRYSYTLPLWWNFVADCQIICVFREPAKTAQSMVKEAMRDSQSRGVTLRFDLDDALEVWTLMYQHIMLNCSRLGGSWHFFHYNQLLQPDIGPRFAQILDAKVDSAFMDLELNRSSNATISVPHDALLLYARMCALAGCGPEFLPKKDVGLNDTLSNPFR